MVTAVRAVNPASGIERLSSVKSIAKVLGASDVDVQQMLEENRLAGVLISALSRKGISVTPSMKNTVEGIVKSLSPQPRDDDQVKQHAFASESTVTIMFTDIVDSTAMTERLGDQRAREVHRAHDEFVRTQVEVFGGRVIKSMGDGAMLSFSSARGGVSCAIAIQQKLNEYNSLNPETQMAVRMGLSVGEPIREEKDLFGKAVIMAARVSAKASGGQVFVSEIVHALLASTGVFSFTDAGRFELKGINGTQQIHEVLWR